MRTLVNSLWIIESLTIALVPAAMLVRKNYKAHPLFFAYVCFQTLVAWVLFALYRIGCGGAYFYVFWVATAGGVILGFLILRELFLNTFKPYDSLREFGSILFRWAAVVLVIIAIVMAMTSNQQGQNFTASFFMTLERSILMMQCGLVIFMFLFAPHLGLTLRHHLFGIAIGFGITASMDLISATLMAYGVGNPDSLNVIKMAAEIAAFSVWTYYMLSPDPERRVASRFAQAQTWNFELSTLHHATQESAFLPNIVDTVERVLSRRTATDIYMHSTGAGRSLPN